jgi:Tol biopolymer transport system component
MATVSPRALHVGRMSRSRMYGLAVLAGIAVLLVAAVAIWWFRPASHPATSTASLTNYPGLQIQPAFSPDGKKVAFAWDGEKRENFDIYVKVVGAGAPLRLTSNLAAEYHPAWSADGRYIAFCRAMSGRFEIWSIAALGGAERKLGESAVCEGLSWSSDGKSLAFVDKVAQQASNSIFSLSVETGEKRRLTSPPNELLGDFSPRFSPDRKTVAFRRASSSDNNDVYVLSVGVGGKPDGTPRRLTFRKDTISGFDWTADGRGIVFLAGNNLWTISASGGMPERLAVASENADALSVSRSGSRLVYQRHVFDFNIWRVGLGDPGRRPGNPVPFISSPKPDYQPSVSPNGRRIAFVSERTGGPEVWVCDADGSNSVQLTSLGTPNLFGPRWSPDGENIGFTAQDGLKLHIHVVSAKGGKPRRLITQSTEDDSPYWSHDGKWLYFTSDRSGRSEIWKMPSKGGEAVQITSHEADGGEESPDGRFFYYSKGWPLETSSLWRIPAKGGEEVKVLDSVNTVGLWTLAREGIYFFTAPDKQGHSDIQLDEFSTGKIRRILTIERGVGAQIAVSPDSRWILYTHLDEAASDLMLVENYR